MATDNVLHLFVNYAVVEIALYGQNQFLTGVVRHYHGQSALLAEHM